MSRARFLKFVIFCHRWLGVAWCLLFALWFTSGIVMMYWSFPEVEAADRLARSPALEASRIQVSPQDAYASLRLPDPSEQAQLSMFNGRPVYRFRSGRQQPVVYADDGQPRTETSRELGEQIAAAWTGQPVSAEKFEGSMTEVDQWTVGGPGRALWPLLKYSWPDGEEVYVSTVSGDVVQYTTRGSRLAAYFGAIPHWLYFTPLRRNGVLWRKVVLWASGVGIVVSLLGILVGIWMYSPRKRTLSARVVEFPLHRSETLARHPGIDVRACHLHVGLQRPAFHATLRPADRRAERGRTPCRRPPRRALPARAIRE
jgi:hypothetical protein